MANLPQQLSDINKHCRVGVDSTPDGLEPNIYPSPNIENLNSSLFRRDHFRIQNAWIKDAERAYIPLKLVSPSLSSRIAVIIIITLYKNKNNHLILINFLSNVIQIRMCIAQQLTTTNFGVVQFVEFLTENICYTFLNCASLKKILLKDPKIQPPAATCVSYVYFMT